MVLRYHLWVQGDTDDDDRSQLFESDFNSSVYPFTPYAQQSPYSVLTSLLTSTAFVTWLAGFRQC